VNGEKGEREYKLRQKFKDEWESLEPTDRFGWFERACHECNRSVDAIDSDFVAGLVEVYAWTIFAEAMDPDEARKIANVGFHTAADLVGTADSSPF
jgi:hypothetical protein